MKICPICGKENEEDQTLCLCGFNFQGTDYIPSSKDGESRSIVREKKRRLLGKRHKIIICLVVSLIMLCAAGYTVYYNSNVHWNKKFDPVLYVADGKIMCADVAKPYASAMEVDDAKGETSDYFSLPDSLFMSEDNKLLIYPNNYQTSEDDFTATYDLYLFDFENPKTEGKKIAASVSSHTVNVALDTITCLKGEGESAELYQYDMNGAETYIADNVSAYSISSDGTTVIYESFDGEVFIKQKDKDIALISKNATVEYIADDFSEFFCLEEGKLTKYTVDGKKTLIDEDVATDNYFSFGFSDGKGYYTKLQKEYPLSDYLTDDMAKADEKAGLSEEKLMRDEIRLEVYGDDAEKICLYSLYYYDGEKSHFVSDNVSYGFVEQQASGDCCVYSVSESQDFEKIKMSEFSELVENSEVYSFYAYLTSPENMNEKHFVCFESQSTAVEGAVFATDIIEFKYHAEEKAVYYTVSDGNTEYANFYKSEINGGEFSESELIAEDISALAFYTLPKGDYVYMKENEKGEEETSFSLYLNGEIISENVIGYHEFDYPVENILFLQSYSEENEEYEYIHISEKGVNNFKSSSNIDYGDSAQFTEKGGIILYDSMSFSGFAVFANGNKSADVYLGSVETDMDGFITSSFSIPHHPKAVIDESNYDWTELLPD